VKCLGLQESHKRRKPHDATLGTGVLRRGGGRRLVQAVAMAALDSGKLRRAADHGGGGWDCAAVGGVGVGRGVRVAPTPTESRAVSGVTLVGVGREQGKGRPVLKNPIGSNKIKKW
jgi:hypothetical protein